jgi:Fe-S cluster assembly protein SufD
MTTGVMEEKDTYLSNFAEFEKQLPGNGRSPLHALRTAAIERFAELGFPSARHEDWRFTNVAPLARVPFLLAGPARVGGGKIEQVTFDTGPSSRLVFVNGRYAPELSSVRPLPGGVVVASLAEALDRHREQIESHLGKYARFEDHAFVALNTAFVRDGAFVLVPRSKVVEEPIHLVFLTAARGEPAMAHPRNLFVIGDNAQVRVVETYAGLDGGVSFTNAVTELVAGDSAVVDHCKIQREAGETFHVAVTQVHQAQSSNFTSAYVGLGGSLVRNELRSVLDGEGCECTLNGLYMASGRQHMDNFTVIDHARAHCASHELYKGILDGKAHGVFNGKIFVRPDAQKTDAKQTNQTLLLSEDATINTKPQLEIYADDVKCTHGATVGQLDEESIFYLRSRGIDRQAARALLTYAFANDVIGRVKVGPLRAQLEDVLLASQQLPAGKEGV